MTDTTPVTPAEERTACTLDHGDGNAVTAWFGDGFAQLHPLLQALHRGEGHLRGTVSLRFGAGLAGIVGRRLAQRLGLPTVAGAHAMSVEIGHDAHTLWWNRCFEDRHRVCSRFRPQGRWPDGYWIESTGPLELRLAVDVIDGGWHWRVIGMRLRGVRVPLWLMPLSRAYKRIEEGRYRFFVGFSLPLLGEVVSYNGLLDARLSE